MSHTPGPWEFDEGHIFSAEKQSIAQIYYDDIDEAEAEANGSLMAAAPDLLAACKDFIEWLEPDMGDDRERFAMTN